MIDIDFVKLCFIQTVKVILKIRKNTAPSSLIGSKGFFVREEGACFFFIIQ